MVKLLKETYGHDNVAARADQISVRLEENSALINTNTKVKALSHYSVSYLRIPAYEKYHSYAGGWKTLTYARGIR